MEIILTTMMMLGLFGLIIAGFWAVYYNFKNENNAMAYLNLVHMIVSIVCFGYLMCAT